ncbi:MAG: hypothetical protein IKC50_06320 [Oscillospiraceae bacterium]|nr:hypothetical protein [Oscillospiraceae bacterium]MBR2977865.1 hypothetical protein [Oscillospiraceae bacterium]
MKYCQHCGAEVNENAVVCVKCGCSLQQANANQSKEVDNSVSTGLVVLAVLIPLFGIIYWPVKAKERPKCAQACGIAAIISWVVCFVITMLASGL